MNVLVQIHFQIGKFYDYQGALASDNERGLLANFKALVDPGGLINPGALGLG